MTVYHWILTISFGICFFICSYLFLQIILAGAPNDRAKSKGNCAAAITYSLTIAMSPTKKETAYRHLPTYTAGIIYHIGTFLSFALLVIKYFSIHLTDMIWAVSVIFLVVSGTCGAAILIKRIALPKMRGLSNPDDYISNILVTGFHFLSALTAFNTTYVNVLFVYSSVLLVYIPAGKLKHVIYFFTSRIHLGIFYGRRGVWSLKGKR